MGARRDPGVSRGPVTGRQPDPHAISPSEASRSPGAPGGQRYSIAVTPEKARRGTHLLYGALASRTRKRGPGAPARLQRSEDGPAPSGGCRWPGGRSLPAGKPPSRDPSATSCAAIRCSFSHEVGRAPIQQVVLNPVTTDTPAVLEEARRANPGIGDALPLPAPIDPSPCVSRWLSRDRWDKAEALTGLESRRGRDWHLLRQKFAPDWLRLP